MPMTVNSAEISLAMSSGRVWTGKLDMMNRRPSSLKRADEIYQDRLSVFAYDPNEPAAAVFADMFAFFKALAGVSSISPAPDLEDVVSRTILMKEAATWLAFMRMSDEFFSIENKNFVNGPVSGSNDTDPSDQTNTVYGSPDASEFSETEKAI